MAATSTASKPTATVDIEAATVVVTTAHTAPAVVVTTAATASSAGRTVCKKVALTVIALLVLAAVFAGGFLARGPPPPPMRHNKLTIDGEQWRGGGVLDIEETARALVRSNGHGHRGTKSAIVHVTAEEVDASQTVRAKFIGARAPPAGARQLKGRVDEHKDDESEHWTFDEVEVKLLGAVVAEADVPVGARKQFLAADGTGVFAFTLVDAHDRVLGKLECDDSMRCRPKPHEPDAPRAGETAARDEHGEETTYTCWDAAAPREPDWDEEVEGPLQGPERDGEREQRSGRASEKDEREPHECAVVMVTIPTEAHRTCHREIVVPCEDERENGKMKCVQHVEVRC